MYSADATVPANIMVTVAEFCKISLSMRTLKGPTTMFMVLFKRLSAMVPRRKMYAMGNAICIGLRQGLIDANVPLIYNTPLLGLVVENGRVGGVEVEHKGERRQIMARKGVILGSGGFEHNQELREKWLPAPTDSGWSTGSKNNNRCVTC